MDPSPLPLTSGSTFFDLLRLVQAGQAVHVEFKDEVEPWAGYLDTGMRGVIRDGRERAEGVVELDVDLAPYRAHNLRHERADYVDAAGHLGLTATEAGKDVAQVIVAVNGANALAHSAMLGILPAWAVAAHERYRASSSPLSYTLWLEQQLHQLGLG
jgi:hypothetical protein